MFAVTHIEDCLMKVWNWIIHIYFLEVNPSGQLLEQKGTLERWGMRWVAGLAFFSDFLVKNFSSRFFSFYQGQPCRKCWNNWTADQISEWPNLWDFLLLALLLLYFVLRNAWPDVFYAEWDRRRTCDSICTYIFARECECSDDVIGYA